MKSCIVIGAGILGASTAYHLARSGVKVTVVDRNDKGQATDAAAGIVCPWLSQRRNKAWYSLAKGGAKYYASLVEQLIDDGETDIGYKKVGAISLHSDEKKLDKMVERALLRREDAPEIGEITRLTAEETRGLFPYVSEEFGSVHISGAARVNGRALRNALNNASRKHGATIINGDATFIVEQKKIMGISVDDQPIYADQYIVTAGVWARELLKTLGIDFLVTPQKAQIVHLEVANTDTSNWPIIMPPNDQYILSFDKGRVVVGATHENDKELDDNLITIGGLHEIFDKALSIAPGLSDATLLETRVGFRPFTPDFLPVIGALPGYDGLLVANGLGSSGLTVGPYLGSELAKLALGMETEIDLGLYNVAGAIV